MTVIKMNFKSDFLVQILHCHSIQNSNCYLQSSTCVTFYPLVLHFLKISLTKFSPDLKLQLFQNQGDSGKGHILLMQYSKHACKTNTLFREATLYQYVRFKHKQFALHTFHFTGSRMVNLKVTYSNGGQTNSCGYYPGSMAKSGDVILFQCPPDARGSSVKLMVQSPPGIKNYFSLCEVEVYQKKYD